MWPLCRTMSLQKMLMVTSRFVISQTNFQSTNNIFKQNVIQVVKKFYLKTKHNQSRTSIKNKI